MISCEEKLKRCMILDFIILLSQVIIECLTLRYDGLVSVHNSFLKNIFVLIICIWEDLFINLSGSVRISPLKLPKDLQRICESSSLHFAFIKGSCFPKACVEVV